MRTVEEELRRRLEEYRALAENSPDIVDRFDRDFRHLYVNAAGARALGRPAAEIIGRTIAETAVPEPYRRLWEHRIRQVFDTAAPIEVEDTFPTPQGVRLFHSRCVPETGDSGGVASVLVISRDVTERRKAEDELNTLEQRLHNLADNLSNAMVYQLTTEADGARRFTYVSRGVEWLNEVTVAEVLADAGVLYRQVLPDYVERVREAEDRALRTLTTMRVEVRSRLPSGRVRWFEYTSTPRRLPDGLLVWDGVEVDITERREAEEALRRSEEQLRLSARAARIGAFDLDLATGQAAGSKEFCEILGLPEDAPADVALLLQRVHPEDLDRTRYELQRAMAHPGDSELEYRVLGRDGSVRCLLMRASASAAPEGTVTRMLGVLMDITDLRRAQREALEQRQAAQLQRMESLATTGRLAAGVAHEINNPLQGISAQLRLLRDDLPAEFRENRRLRLIHDGLGRIAHIVHSLLQLHRAPQGVRETCCVADVVGSVAELIAPMALSARVRVETDIRPPDLACPLSAVALTQVLLNLALNGIDAMPGGGVLRLQAHLEDGATVLHITDSGIGIPPGHQARLFSPFFTTKGPKGTGLGLSVTHSLVTSAGGTLDLVQREGKGAAFMIRFASLPRAPGSPKA